MIDHNSRILAKMQSASEEAEIARMQCKLEPLVYAIIAVAAALLIGTAFNVYVEYKSNQATSKAFASALNGNSLQAGDTTITCTATENKLVEGMK